MDESLSVVPNPDIEGMMAETEPIVEQPVTPTEPQEPVTPTEEPKEAEPELVELPDGRKVDAATVAQEYKNLLSDYTKKSQELANYKQAQPTETQPKEEWVPKSYDDIIEKAKQEVFKTLEQTEQQKMEQHARIEAEVSNQLAEIKTADPTLNENALFQHAMKYGFKDLKIAHQNMKDMNALVKNVQETTAKNIAKRQDPVSIQPGAGAGRPDPSQFSSATDYFRSITGSN